MYMYDHIYTFIWAISFVLGAFALVFTVFSGKRAGTDKNERFRAIVCFNAFTILQSAVYFLFGYRTIGFDIFYAQEMLRLLDYLSCIGVVFTWALCVYIFMQKQQLRVLTKVMIIIFSSMLLIELLSAVFLIDDNYVAMHPIAEVINFSCEMILGTTVFIYMVVGYREAAQRHTRRFILSVSLLLLISIINQIYLDEKILTGNMTEGVDAKLLDIADVTCIATCIINILIAFYVYREDFSKLFAAGKTVVPEDMTELEKETIVLNRVASEHALTSREREILDYVYEGYSNPEISKQLNISLNTVKWHIHNIYEKMDVSTRAELMHFISSYRL